MAEIRNRELSQFSSFLHIEDASQQIGISSTSDSPFVGIGTNNPTSKLTVNGDVLVSGVLTATSASLNNLTIGTGNITIISGSNLYYSGIGTINTLNSVSGIITNFSSGISSITQLRAYTGIVTNLSGTGVTYTSSNFTNLYATNSYLVTGIATNLSGSTINYSGISTFSGIQISSGIITATSSGIVTYYGDGGKLTGILQSIGVRSDGNLIGYAVTTLNFTGSGIGTVTDTFAGITTIFIDGQSAGGSTNQVQYNYQGGFAGSANFTFDGSALVSVAGTVSATNFNTTSDLNFKENVKTVENALEVVSQLRGVHFDWKETHYPSIGVIAQEVETILPELVTTAEHKTVNYNGIIGVLIEAIKELQTQVEELKNHK